MITPRSARLASAAGVLLAVACSSILGIEDRELRSDPGGPDASAGPGGGGRATGGAGGAGTSGAPGAGLVGPPPVSADCIDFLGGAPCSDCICGSCGVELDACRATGGCAQGLACLLDSGCYRSGLTACQLACPEIATDLGDLAVDLGNCVDSCVIGCDYGVGGAPSYGGSPSYGGAAYGGTGVGATYGVGGSYADPYQRCESYYGSDPCSVSLCNYCSGATVADCVDFYDCAEAVRCVADTGCQDGPNCDMLGCPTEAAGGPPPHIYEDLVRCVDVAACRSPCELQRCNGNVYSCGNCVDDDGDGRLDLDDPECHSACDDDEGSFGTGLPGDSLYPGASGTVECAFDGNAGVADDGCVWNYQCDSLGPFGFAYDPAATFSGQSCATASSGQTAACVGTCQPRTPNGCDCFGCCELPPRSGNFVHIGGECDMGLADCPACTPVPSCENRCDTCELCLGDGTRLPPGCSGPQICPPASQPCGRPGDATCPEPQVCSSGCCVP